MSSSYGQIHRGPMAADVVGRHFTQVHNDLFRDPRLSAKAKGVFGLISTHEQGYGITPASIAACMRDGVDAVKGALRELEEYGYLLRVQERTAKGTLGRATYYVTDVPGMVDLGAYLRTARSGPQAGIPPMVLTSGNTGAAPGPAGADLGKRQKPRSGPVGEIPPAVEPPAVDSPPKNTSLENTKLEETEEEAARGARGDQGDADRKRQTARPSYFAVGVIRRIVETAPQCDRGRNEFPEVIGDVEVDDLARAFDAECVRLAEHVPIAAGDDLGNWLARGLASADSLYAVLRARLRPGYATSRLIRPRRVEGPLEAPLAPPAADAAAPGCTVHGSSGPGRCGECESAERAMREEARARTERGAALARQLLGQD